jgi:hypothetical protein
MGTVLSNVLGIVFTLLGVLIAFLQWQPQSRFEVQAQTRGVSFDKQGGLCFYEQIEGMAPGISKIKGAIVVYTNKDLRGSTVNLSFGFHSSTPKVDVASSVIGRKRNRSTIYLTVFSSLEPGNYTIYTDSQEFVTRVSVLSGRVAEVDWR